MGPASTFQVALVPPYGEVDNAVIPIPKDKMAKQGDMPQRSYRGHKESMGGKKKIMEQTLENLKANATNKDQFKTGFKIAIKTGL